MISGKDIPNVMSSNIGKFEERETCCEGERCGEGRRDCVGGGV
jgi:hypothetical protein